MAVVDVRRLPSDRLVVHYGGRPTHVDVNTFAHSLIGLSEAIREINREVNPDYKIEIVIEALGEGSFRAKLKTASKKLPGLFKACLSA